MNTRQMIAQLQVKLYGEGQNFIHFTASQKIALEAEEAFAKALCDEDIWGEGGPNQYDRRFAKFLPLSHLSGATNSRHVPVVFFEDEKNMLPQALFEAQSTVAPEDGVGPIVIKL